MTKATEFKVYYHSLSGKRLLIGVFQAENEKIAKQMAGEIIGIYMAGYDENRVEVVKGEDD